MGKIMFRKGYIVVAILWVAIFSSVRAQYSPFVRAGLSFPTIAASNNNYQTSSTVGFYGGGGVLLEVAGFPLEAEPSAQVALRGGTLKNENVKVGLKFLCIDGSLMINLPLTLGQTGVFIGAGPAYSYTLLGWDTSQNSWKSLDLNKQLALRHDILARAQAGIRIKGHQLSAMFEMSFINFSKAEDTRLTHRGWGIAYGYIF